MRRTTDRRRTHEREIIRLLKRAIAREVFRLLTIRVQVPGIADLYPARQTKNITLTAAAHHFGVWPAVISNIERGLRRGDAFADPQRQCLTTA
ncbi:hypothetical protein ACFCXT_09680 [Streptomyces vinaceus]|uniref:hypothetical protein n=1 Tax=Streptomyces vinaceus TaxID=1960 RepID=UPI0035D5E684